MSDIAWGAAAQGVRFGLVQPARPFEAGGQVVLSLACENGGLTPIWLFGFQPHYPRSLRVSPPRAERPHLRVSFGDTNVIHSLDGFLKVDPKATVYTPLDLSFVFDRRGAGSFPLVFGYDAVRAGFGIVPWAPPSGPAQTALIDVNIEGAKVLREAGIDDRSADEIDDLLLRDPPNLLEQLRTRGRGATLLLARRVARTMSTGAEAQLGWRALDVLRRLGREGELAAQQARVDLPHAAPALEFTVALLASDRGEPAAERDLPFATMLNRLIHEPDMRGNFLLSWTPYDSPVHGSRRLELFGNGQVLVSQRKPGDVATTTRRSTLTLMQLQAVLDSLRIAKVWLLSPLRADAMPDEPRPSLEVQLGLGETFARRVSMWNGEWRQGPASGLADLLDRVASDGAQG